MLKSDYRLEGLFKHHFD